MGYSERAGFHLPIPIYGYNCVFCKLLSVLLQVKSFKIIGIWGGGRATAAT